jgi:hypothetical protein
MKQVFLGVVIAVMAMSIALAQTKSQTAVPSNSETLADVRRAIDKGNAQWSEGWAKGDSAMVAAVNASRPSFREGRLFDFLGLNAGFCTREALQRETQ